MLKEREKSRKKLYCDYFQHAVVFRNPPEMKELSKFASNS